MRCADRWTRTHPVLLLFAQPVRRSDHARDDVEGLRGVGSGLGEREGAVEEGLGPVAVPPARRHHGLPTVHQAKAPTCPQAEAEVHKQGVRAVVCIEVCSSGRRRSTSTSTSTSGCCSTSGCPGGASCRGHGGHGGHRRTSGCPGGVGVDDVHSCPLTSFKVKYNSLSYSFIVSFVLEVVRCRKRV